MLKYAKIIKNMEESTKSSTIHVPLKLAFTENGSNYVLNNKKELSRLQLVDNSDDHGIEINQFSPALLQRLIILDYVSKLEISSVHFNDNRSEIIDLSKLIIFSKLYQQFNSSVLARLLASDCVTRHNRNNPSKCLDETIAVDDTPFEAHVKKQSENQKRILKLILHPIHESILKNTKYSAEEKRVYVFMTEKFLNSMSFFNWYILLLFSNDSSFPQLIAAIRVLLTDYLPKSSIAEYVAFILLELCSNLEVSNLEVEAKKMHGEKEFKKSMLLDSAIRKKIYKEIERKKCLLFISWKISSGAAFSGKENNLKISVYSTTTDFRGTKDSIDEKKSMNIRKKTLVDLYKDLPRGYIGNDLGLYYLSYLDDACKQVNVKFTANVNQIISDGLTLIDLNFKF